MPLLQHGQLAITDYHFWHARPVLKSMESQPSYHDPKSSAMPKAAAGSKEGDAPAVHGMGKRVAPRRVTRTQAPWVLRCCASRSAQGLGLQVLHCCAPPSTRGLCPVGTEQLVVAIGAVFTTRRPKKKERMLAHPLPTWSSKRSVARLRLS